MTAEEEAPLHIQSARVNFVFLPPHRRSSHLLAAAVIPQDEGK